MGRPRHRGVLRESKNHSVACEFRPNDESARRTQALAHAEAENHKTNAYLTFSHERALASAREVDRKIAAGEEIGPLAGFAAPDEPDYEALARLAGSGFIAIFLDAPFAERPGWKVVGGAPLVQMVWQGTDLPEIPAPEPIVRLRAADSAEMIELTNLTKPGPFGARTHVRGIRARGETPFLHSRADNARAIGLYERLGFRQRFAGHFVVLARE